MKSVVIEKITRRAIEADKKIVLPEAEDPRVIQAARQIVDRKYARVLLLGDPARVRRAGEELGVDLSDVEVISPLEDSLRPKYIDLLCERRKHKGLTLEEADRILTDPVYYGGMLVGDCRVDGMVCGSICPTRDTVRSALFGVGLAEGNETVSACSLMLTIIPEVGVDGALIFADTGVVREPTAARLADIAIAAAKACRALLDTEPYVAMLSFSTKGSADSTSVQRVIDATRLARGRRADLKIDGELQLDAAIIPQIADRKAKGSPVAGRANTLIFPDLSCGNIAYKLVERLGKATALGPLLQGLAKPVNDLSRGCSLEDIVLVAAVTAVEASMGRDEQSVVR